MLKQMPIISYFVTFSLNTTTPNINIVTILKIDHTKFVIPTPLNS